VTTNIDIKLNTEGAVLVLDTDGKRKTGSAWWLSANDLSKLATLSMRAQSEANGREVLMVRAYQVCVGDVITGIGAKVTRVNEHPSTVRIDWPDGELLVSKCSVVTITRVIE